MPSHESVLAEEVLKWLEPAAGKTMVDGTVGLGGHAERILEQSAPDGRLIGFDKDAAAIAEARKRLQFYGERVMLIHDDFKNLAEHLKPESAQGVLLDLGVSSMQFDEAERGFSFRSDAPLDMRMDRRQKLTAAGIVNEYPERALLEILWNLGEERFARKIVSRILDTRARKKITTTVELATLISESVPGRYRYGRIHPATRTFQALRIAVNGELDSLREFLTVALSCLSSGGRLVIISFHSLEDRLVKTAFKEFQSKDEGRILTKKPLVAAESEVAANPRARSAKLRAFEKGEAR